MNRPTLIGWSMQSRITAPRLVRSGSQMTGASGSKARAEPPTMGKIALPNPPKIRPTRPTCFRTCSESIRLKMNRMLCPAMCVSTRCGSITSIK